MRIPPNGPRPVDHSPASINSDRKVPNQKFSEQLSPKASLATQVSLAADIIDDVKGLALSLRSGALTKEEASKKFVTLVLEKRHNLNSLGESGKFIEEAVKEFAGEDPQFIASLAKQLQKLA